jgi:mannitol/fructose-specific phosphotransferase system IIA component (Ntr-type)
MGRSTRSSVFIMANKVNRMNRRRFLSSTLGLTASTVPLAAAHACPQTVQSPVRSDASACTAYERLLARTDRLHWLGLPRSWSPVREGFHPIPPERVVILPGRPAHCEENRQAADVKELLLRRHSAGARSHVSPQKIELIVRLLDQVTTYYHAPELLADWADRLVRREALGTSGMDQHFALPHQFQTTGIVRTVNPPVDWWLFLFPEGVPCWESLDEQPVHAMLLHILALPRLRLNGLEQIVLCLASHAAREIPQACSWPEVSRMDRVSAARCVNQGIVRCVDCVPR